MYKISLMDQSDLDAAYEIEKKTNLSPWSKENFFSSLEVGHRSLVCKLENIIIGFVIYSNFEKEVSFDKGNENAVFEITDYVYNFLKSARDNSNVGNISQTFVIDFSLENLFD